MKGRNYYSFKEYLRKRYGDTRVYKVTVDAGFTCPNRDGKISRGGCSFCENRSFSPNARDSTRSNIRNQIQSGMVFLRERFNAEKFIVYFQAYTNTYAPVETLESYYDLALEADDVVGLAIGTRPDCVPDEVLDLVNSYTDRLDVWMEYGLQSIYDSTLDRINRGHHYKDFLDAVRRTHRYEKLHITVHIIHGLPGETTGMMLDTVRSLNHLPIDSLKIHHFYISPQTRAEKEYRDGKIRLFTLDEWISIVVESLRCLRPGISIQRLMGELYGSYVTAPLWGESKTAILNRIDEWMLDHDIHHGDALVSIPGAGIQNERTSRRIRISTPSLTRV